jgi:hypothetical protein
VNQQRNPRWYSNDVNIDALLKSVALLIDEFGELDVQRHAMYCLWMMEQGKVHVPPQSVAKISQLEIVQIAKHIA